MGDEPQGYTWLEPARQRIGAERMERMIRALGALDVNVHLLVMAIGFAKDQGYSDEYLATLRTDADDVVKAALDLQQVVVRTTDAWEAQRKKAEPGWAPEGDRADWGEPQ